MQNIDDFLENLLKEKGITSVDPETRGEVKNEMRQRLVDQINRAAIMQLSEEKANELTEKLNNPEFTDEQMTQFVKDAGVNLTEVALDTMLKFRGFYLGTEA